MRTNEEIIEPVYMSKQDRSLKRRLEKLMATPEAKNRLIGESFGYYKSKCMKGNKKEKSVATKYIYTRYLLHFLIWLDSDTEQLYKTYYEMVHSADERKSNKMQEIISDFQDWYVEDRGVTYCCADNIYCALQGFFVANELSLKYWSRGHEYIPAPYISHGQLRAILMVTLSLKVIAYLMFAKDSGMRISDLVALRIRSIRKVLNDPSMQFHTFEIRVIKTGLMANPVIGPEAIHALLLWMDYRVNVLGLSANDNDYVFCAEKASKGHIDKNGVERLPVVKGDLLDSSCLSTNFSRLMRKAGIKILPGEKKLPSIHSCIKFYTTNLEDGGCPVSSINKMKGRKGEGTHGVYVRPPEKMLIAQYRGAYAKLSLREIVQDNEMQELRHRLAEVQQELAQVTRYQNLLR